jgi:hypothetical protein
MQWQTDPISSTSSLGRVLEDSNSMTWVRVCGLTVIAPEVLATAEDVDPGGRASSKSLRRWYFDFKKKIRQTRWLARTPTHEHTQFYTSKGGVGGNAQGHQRK